MQTADLTPVQWDVADAIARTLVREGLKVNELQKSLAYLRTYCDREGAGTKFFDYLQVLSREGRRVGHSQETQRYYATLNQTCRQYLQGSVEDGRTMLLVLGWAARLVRYYSEGVLTGEITVPIVRSEREIAVQSIAAEAQFAVGQVLLVKVAGVKGNKVTYEIEGGLRLTQKEPKKAEVLSEGQEVRVEVVEMYEDGRIKKVRLLD